MGKLHQQYNHSKLIYSGISDEFEEKAMEYRKLLGLDAELEPNSTAQDNETDAFRHAFLSASLARKYGSLAANLIGNQHEYNPKNPDKTSAVEMDLWNNRVGRKIGLQVADEIKGMEKLYSEKEIEDLMAIKIYNALKKGDIISGVEDPRILKGSVSKNVVRDISSYFETQGELLDKRKRTQPPSHSLKQMLSAQKEKLFKLQDSLGQSVKNKNENENENAQEKDKVKKGVSLPDEKDKIFDENADLAEYKNEITNDNKIFTAEQIDNMSDDEYEKNVKAIIYQRKTIGVPTKEQAQKAVKNGGLVYVKGYSRSDGTDVKSYYRSRKASTI